MNIMMSTKERCVYGHSGTEKEEVMLGRLRLLMEMMLARAEKPSNMGSTDGIVVVVSHPISMWWR